VRHRAVLATSVLLLAGALTAAPASAGGLPKLLANFKCAHPCTHFIGIYKIKPPVIYLTNPEGGNLNVAWSSWTATLGSGSGTSVVSNMGTTTTVNIVVSASRVRHGLFTRLTIMRPDTSAPPERLRLHDAQWVS
jgi:hypothetical protein